MGQEVLFLPGRGLSLNLRSVLSGASSAPVQSGIRFLQRDTQSKEMQNTFVSEREREREREREERETSERERESEHVREREREREREVSP